MTHLNNVVSEEKDKTMEPIKDLLDEAKRRGFRPTAKPYLDMESQGGWVVNGIADFKKIKGGCSSTHTGWVFDNEADANNFYNMTAAHKNKEALDGFFSKII
jgi:hypothetical protein